MRKILLIILSVLLLVLSLSSCKKEEIPVETDEFRNISEREAIALLYENFGTEDENGNAYNFYMTVYRVKIDEALYYYGIWQVAFSDTNGDSIVTTGYKEKSGVFVSEKGNIIYTGYYNPETKKCDLLLRKIIK